MCVARAKGKVTNQTVFGMNAALRVCYRLDPAKLRLSAANAKVEIVDAVCPLSEDEPCKNAKLHAG
jgi:hypothetical protein